MVAGLQVAFRTDASIEIGAGHVMRCLTLAQALKDGGADCRFICCAHPGNLVALIRQLGFETYSFDCHPEGRAAGNEPYAAWLGNSWKDDADATCAILPILGKQQDWLVVDHYALDVRWERRLRPYCKKLLIIDDLADRQHVGDILLDQTFGRTGDSYSGLANPECELRCGTEHVLLRPEFDSWRDRSLARRQLPDLHRILVNLGGVDKDNLTREILIALNNCFGRDAGVEVCVVLGESSPWIASLRELSQALRLTIRIVVGVRNMAELLAGCDLAIGAAGTSSWERCCLGVPSLILVLADNQRAIATALAEAHAVKLLNPGPDLEEQLVQVLHTLRLNPNELRAMSRNASALVTGSGTKGLARAMAGAVA